MLGYAKNKDLVGESSWYKPSRAPFQTKVQVSGVVRANSFSLNKHATVCLATLGFCSVMRFVNLSRDLSTPKPRL